MTIQKMIVDNKQARDEFILYIKEDNPNIVSIYSNTITTDDVIVTINNEFLEDVLVILRPLIPKKGIQLLNKDGYLFNTY